MKKIFFIIFFIAISSCTSHNKVYWCGDHACINKKEREAYFKKTMIVEVRNLKAKDVKKDPKLEKIVKQEILSEKERLKNEKKLQKQALKAEKKKN